MNLTSGTQNRIENLPYELSGEDGLSSVPRIWFGSSEPYPQTRFFRKRILTKYSVSHVELILHAETKFHVWVNGRYVSRGPVFHHPDRPAVTRISLEGLWQKGENVVAIHVHYTRALRANAISTMWPGLKTRLVVTDSDGQSHAWQTDKTWRVTDKTGWQSGTPQRGGVIGHVELFDTADAPLDWQKNEFDDSQWGFAVEQDQDIEEKSRTWIDPALPGLRFDRCPVKKLIAAFDVEKFDHVSILNNTSEPMGKVMLEEAWSPIDETNELVEYDGDRGSVKIDFDVDDHDLALVFDLGMEYVGNIFLEGTAASGGVIDVGWSETLLDKRPDTYRQTVTYADRICLQPGAFRWTQSEFSAARFLVLVFRGISGPVELSHVGMLASESKLNWQAEFESSDQSLNAIWKLSEWTIRIGTQEGTMDCPTREQATYIGDALLVGRWMFLMSGDASYWRHTVIETFFGQRADGLIRDSIFSGVRRSLIDYMLLAVIGALDYYRHTNDRDTLVKVLPGCRKVIEWFQSHCRDDGLFDLPWEHMIKLVPHIDKWEDWGRDNDWGINIFIDHAGLGWHTQNEPGIDRRGLNAAINALWIIGLRAQGEIEAVTDHSSNAEVFKQRADCVADKAKKLFWDSNKGLFSDGISQNSLSDQFSQQTNVWCMLAELCESKKAVDVLKTLFKTNSNLVAKCGPYFWAYVLPLMNHLGLNFLAVQEMKKMWGPMTDVGASSLWETFRGDKHDSLCHPWSAAPVEFLLLHVLGLDVAQAHSHCVKIKPRVDLLSQARGSVSSPMGTFEISWQKDTEGNTVLTGKIPPKLSAEILSPEGRRLSVVRSVWQLVVSPADKQSYLPAGKTVANRNKFVLKKGVGLKTNQ